LVAGGIVVLGLAAMVLMGFSHWRAMSRLGDIATALPLSRRLEAGEPLAALGPGEALVSVGPGSVEETNGRLLGVIDRLEKRICELEHVAQAGEKGLSNGNSGGSAHGGSADDRAVTLLGKGQTLISLDKLDEALDCFEEILAENPAHAEALVKKGSVLERLRRVDEAIACYDQAIASGDLMTVAYLHKGGLYNRMERYAEALECYEKALKTQEKAG